MAKKNIAGSIYLLGIGLFLVLLGGGFCWLLWNSFNRASDTRKWVETPCLIINSEALPRSIDGIAKEYQWKVAYKYKFEGEDLIGEKYKPRGQRWRKSITEVNTMMEEYPEGARSICFVNPELPKDPSQQREAILEHDTKAAGYTLWFPALFSIGGLGMMIGAVKGILKEDPNR